MIAEIILCILTLSQGQLCLSLKEITMNLKSSLKLFLLLGISFFSTATGVFALAPEPSFQAFNFSAVSNSCNEIDISCFPGDGQRRLIVCSPDNPVSVVPVDGQAYTAGSLFGSGTNLGNNCFVVYNGTGSSLTVTGLAGGTQYYFASFPYLCPPLQLFSYCQSLP